ncbi:MAG: DUF4357 domain-containing protein [Lactimicrobium sp.]|jgi:hypothetical protein|uniref:DUF4357 domain-containing protein n=1 Tax=Lactimicrobium sp. TaxID=2563780 RepID=UPI002F35B286
MAKGILYIMTTVVPGLIKIGKTRTEQYDSRMYILEHNGYANVKGLKRRFAIEVEDYDEKEQMLDAIFDRSRVPNTELFALDTDRAVELLSSFEGTKIYPKDETKEQVFHTAAQEADLNQDWQKVPDGMYHLTARRTGFGIVSAKMEVIDGSFIVKKGSICAPASANAKMPKERADALIENNVLQEDVTCKSPSAAASVVLGTSADGWTKWLDENDRLIDVFRQKEKTQKTEE